jgi:hypothetical protein
MRHLPDPDSIRRVVLITQGPMILLSYLDLLGHLGIKQNTNLLVIVGGLCLNDKPETSLEFIRFYHHMLQVCDFDYKIEDYTWLDYIDPKSFDFEQEAEKRRQSYKPCNNDVIVTVRERQQINEFFLEIFREAFWVKTGDTTGNFATQYDSGPLYWKDVARSPDLFSPHVTYSTVSTHEEIIKFQKKVPFLARGLESLKKLTQDVSAKITPPIPAELPTQYTLVATSYLWEFKNTKTLKDELLLYYTTAVSILKKSDAILIKPHMREVSGVSKMLFKKLRQNGFQNVFLSEKSVYPVEMLCSVKPPKRMIGYYTSSVITASVLSPQTIYYVGVPYFINMAYIEHHTGFNSYMRMISLVLREQSNFSKILARDSQELKNFNGFEIYHSGNFISRKRHLEMLRINFFGFFLCLKPLLFKTIRYFARRIGMSGSRILLMVS